MHVASFYAFVAITNPNEIQRRLNLICAELDVVGTVLLAGEGINAVLAHSECAQLESIIDQIKSISIFSDIRPVWSTGNPSNAVFDRLEVRIRNEIVTAGRQFDFDRAESRHVDPIEWNALIEEESTLLLDVRNDYETKLGSFRGSISPGTTNFREFPSFVEEHPELRDAKTVAIYCTGGIRCEKAAQILIDTGIKNVVQLDRGILGYLDSNVDHSSWSGECFVFDKRTSVTNQLDEGTAEQCFACRRPLTIEDRKSSAYRRGISCGYCWNEVSSTRREGLMERMKQLRLKKERENQIST